MTLPLLLAWSVLTVAGLYCITLPKEIKHDEET